MHLLQEFGDGHYTRAVCIYLSFYHELHYYGNVGNFLKRMYEFGVGGRYLRLLYARQSFFHSIFKTDPLLSSKDKVSSKSPKPHFVTISRNEFVTSNFLVIWEKNLHKSGDLDDKYRTVRFPGLPVWGEYFDRPEIDTSVEFLQRFGLEVYSFLTWK